MRPIPSVCRFAVLLLTGGAVAYAQSTLPPTAPTAREKTVHRPNVAYESGKLEISADNSSLNEILRDISRETGMKITGAVIDEPVYGKFGPSAPAIVLASLLDGTSSNMLFVQAANRRGPGELILTPKHDSQPLPVASNAASSQTQPATDADANDGQGTFPEEISASSDPATTNSTQAPAPTVVQPVVDGKSSASNDSAQSSNDSNAETTPQQIYQRLQRLQAARAAGNSH